ncbi:MAG: substrate-binding domain-containing protein [Magnetospirillum sp. WYHS-4]
MKRFARCLWAVLALVASDELAAAGPAVKATETPPPVGPRTEMVITGSTLMAPFSEAMAERVAANASLPPARILKTGTTEGMQAFCSGEGLDTPDVVAVSRRMRVFEFERCQKNGVTDIIEILVGYEAVVLVQRKDDKDLPLTMDAVFHALAHELPQNDEFVPNTHKLWSDVDSKLPKTEIRAILPVRTLGARSFFNDRVLQGACRNISELKGIFEAAERVRQCTTLRRDGRVVEVGVPFLDNMRAALSKAPPGTIATMSLRHATELSDIAKIVAFEGVIPSRETVANREYEFVRPLYYYVKKAHVKDYTGKGLVGGLRELITEMTRDATVGTKGYLIPLGVVPMPEDERIAVRDASLRLARFER